jgi:regulator of PEP synthase PpsR (kinase-PPPase family)
MTVNPNRVTAVRIARAKILMAHLDEYTHVTKCRLQFSRVEAWWYDAMAIQHARRKLIDGR